MNNYNKGLITCILSTFFLSTYSIFGKILLKNLIPETLVALAQVLSVITLLLFFGIFSEIKKIHHLQKKDLFWLFIMSIFSAVFAPLFLLKGLEITTATNSVIIGRLDPVFAGIIAFFWLKESLTKYQIFGGILMFFGIFIIITKGLISGIYFNYGDFFIVISAFLWALSTNIFKKFLSHICPELIVIARNTIGSIILFFIIPLIFDIQHNIGLAFDKNVLIPLVMFSFFTIVFAQLLWYKTLELIPATVASTIGLTSPLFGVILAVIILKENIYFYHLFGGIFIFLGLILTVIHHQKHPSHNKLEKMKHWYH